jgi:hypothetical protein
LVALFKEDIVRKWRQPDLRLTLKLDEPDCGHGQMVLTTVQDEAKQPDISAPCYIFRMQVKNHGIDRADHVQVYVTEISRKDASGVFQDIPGFLPLNLQWTHSTSSGPDAFADVINPGMMRYLDFGHIIDPSMNEVFKHIRPDIRPSETVFTFFSSMTLQSNVHLIKRGDYKMKLLASASNGSPKSVSVEFL